MPEQQKSYFRNFVLLFTGNSISQVIPFLLAPVIGRIYSPQQLAVQENFLVLVSLISIVVAGRYEIAFVLPKIQKRANNLFVLALLITICISLLSLLAMIFSNEISKWYKEEELGKYIFYLSPAVFLVGMNNIFIQWIIRSGKYSLVSVSRISQSVTQSAGYALLGYFGWGINGLIIAWLIGNIIPCIILLFPSLHYFNRKDIDVEEIKSVAKEYKDFPMVNSFHAFTGILAEQFLLFFLITRNYGVLVLGLFAVMNRYVRAPLNLVGSAVGQIYYREASEAKNHNLSVMPLFKKSVKIIAYVSVPMILIVLFFGTDLFAIYLGEKWRAAGEYARIMSPSILFNFLCSPVSSTPLMYDKQRTAYLVGIAGYIVSFGLLFFGINQGYHFETTLWMYSIAMTVYYIFLLLWYRSLIRSN
ncbi:MAG: oligosaccharide flippase family protein [Bacteroidetes bacterium]|nr:oligosaccharide flippase family protein [Bacteroidota bacterium]